MARILVTGAAGFIGRALCRGLVESGHRVSGLTRTAAAPIPGVELRPLGEIGPHTRWPGYLAGADIIVHLANRAHRRRAAGTANTEPASAARLARAAAAAGVRRLVYMSSVRAMAAATSGSRPLRATDPPRPLDPYGRGKLASECALMRAAQDSAIELVVLRPPLVYGPGAKANFRALMRLAATGLPLPFAGVDNRRSMIFVEHLVDLMLVACLAPAAGGRVWLARDGRDLSTPQLLRALAEGLGRPARLYAAPDAAFAALRALPAIGPLVARLTLSLVVDDAATRTALGWQPKIAPEQALSATAAAFRQRR